MNFIRVTPFLHVNSVDETVRFFVERLGFRAWILAHDYAYVQRETAGSRILLNSGRVSLGDRRWLYYIDVRDLDSLIEEIEPKLRDLPTTDVFGPKDQDYGQHEYMVKLPDGMVLVFGQEIARKR